MQEKLENNVFTLQTSFVIFRMVVSQFQILKISPADRFIEPVGTSKQKIVAALEYATVDLIPPSEYTIEFWSRECKQTVIVH